MPSANRKALVAAYRERKTIAGVFAVICNATGQVWVGTSRHIDTQQNGLWFTLRMGSHLNRPLQAVWAEHGEGEFRFEQLDRLPADTSDMARDTELKSRSALWTARLGAEKL
jgi:hypothetical protein